MKNFACAAVAPLVIIGVVLAEDLTTVISKVEDGKVTFKKLKINKEDKTVEWVDEQTLPTTTGVNVVKGRFDKDAMKVVAGDPIDGGLKNEMFTEKSGFGGGRFATITIKDG